jgi:hypothetical protein
MEDSTTPVPDGPDVTVPVFLQWYTGNLKKAVISQKELIKAHVDYERTDAAEGGRAFTDAEAIASADIAKTLYPHTGSYLVDIENDLLKVYHERQ